MPPAAAAAAAASEGMLPEDCRDAAARAAFTDPGVSAWFAQAPRLTSVRLEVSAGGSSTTSQHCILHNKPFQAPCQVG